MYCGQRGIASGFNALRTLADFFRPWPGGIDIGRIEEPEWPKATVIEVPFSSEPQIKVPKYRSIQGCHDLVARVCALHRRVEFESDAPVSIDCTSAPLLRSARLTSFPFLAQSREQALRFDLSGGYSLLIRIDGAGPRAFPETSAHLDLARLRRRCARLVVNGPLRSTPGGPGWQARLQTADELPKAWL